MSSFNEFAQELLFSSSIEKKLISPSDLVDTDFKLNLELPLFPARPKHMQINRKKNQVKFPSTYQLDQNNNAGIVMHFFANHELLAIELMALVLLKFPKADPTFRKDIVHTIIEEQHHMRLYLNRMQDFGIEFGDIPASDMFWRTISTMQNPMDFVCRMSLTFEQANLDFCLFYKKLFESVDDSKSASILEEVYQDEIGHVKNGYNWFQVWKDSSKSDWDVYNQHLKFPLTAQRAKGNQFDFNSRKAAGFSDEFIQQFKNYSHSKGRTPDVYYFNPQAELEIAGIPINKKLILLQEKLEYLMCFIAKKDDVVLLHKTPKQSFFDEMQSHGIKLPQLVELKSIDQIKGRKLNRFIPWAWSPKLDFITKQIEADLNPKSLAEKQNHWTSERVVFFDKSIQIKQLNELINTLNDSRLIPKEHIGKVCSTIDEIQNQFKIIEQLGYDKVIIKGRFGAAGNQNLVQTLSKELDKMRIESLMKKHAKVTVESYLNKVIDFSFQFKINQNKDIKFLGLTLFKTDSNGKYLGHKLGKFDMLINREVKQFLRFKNNDGKSIIDQVVNQIIVQLNADDFNQVHSGPFSVDAMVYENKMNELKLQPFLELNPRYTMGYLALKINDLFPDKMEFELNN